ncbi:ABC transporter permease [candidate division WOR-3 bacterium]|nr:ABC transporter permease [candidate division WOR-3 bacterium]
MKEKAIITKITSKRDYFFYFKELFKYRELIFFMTWRDILVQYKQTLIGLAWAVFKPLTTMLIFTFIFGKVAGLPSDGVPYPLLVLSGLLPWQFFSTSLTHSSSSLVSNRELISKIYFPRMILPLSSFGVSLIDFLISLIILLGLMFFYGMGLTWKLVFIPIAVLFCFLLSTGFGLLFSSINVKYRDVNHALPFFIQLSLFLSPVAYSNNLIHGEWGFLLSLNPLTGLVELFRWCFFSGIRINLFSVALSFIFTAAIFFIGSGYFLFYERKFADVI